MERLAYGLLELKPDEFFELTPREFELMLEGFKDRERRKASYLRWLLAPHYKKLPKIQDITGFKEETRQRKSAKEVKEEVNELIARLMPEYAQKRG